MKLKVTIDGETFEVDVGDLTARPVAATIDGERFEVWPEEASAPQPSPAAPAAPRAAVAASPMPPPLAAGRASGDVRAPLPGQIVAIRVSVGDPIAAGQELCTLEAMKMNNVVRAARAGRVAAIRVTVGQQVGHHDVLFELEG
jgi:biotin carboxyl carrier protein